MTVETTTHDRLTSDPGLRRYSDVRELIANPANPTPLVELKHIVPPGDFQLYLKLEWYNPFGSIKDRTAYYLLKGMAERGELDGKKLVEPTSGNTGIALAALAALMGKHLTVTIPDGVPEEKKLLLRMLGAEVWATPDDLCPVNHPKDGAIALAQSFVEGTATGASYAMTKRLFREEGLIVGPSTGAIVHAAVEYGRTHGGVAVAIGCDSGFKYSSFFADVLGDEGLPQV